ncbi:MAG: ATP-binding protein [Candidatus Aminicenantes bacterium]|nr:ATP-binding protein [Candidatus Aminicenantes bacterium]NTV79982.1 ATP-binding protein [Candidatus Aminicenantes bacterium]
MKLPRFFADLGPFLKPNKVLVIYGPRQVGKTTLLKDFLATCPWKHRLDSGEDVRIQEVFQSRDFRTIKEYAAGSELLAIDEAQKIPGIGEALKILVDQVPGLRVIATGSSSFELAGQVGEPLTGRKITLTLYPVAQMELDGIFTPFELRERLEDFLIFGGYPEVVATTDKGEKTRLLTEISSSYLLKDILAFDRVKSPKVLLDLLRLLAFQVGSEASLSELGQKVGLDYKTVGRYIDLLEKSFVIFTLRGFSRNLRNEMTKKAKYYFFDTGIRNALIANFNPPSLRNDIGQLWENFLMMERMKSLAYRAIPVNRYFWRTWQGQEIDLVEEREGRLLAYEFKWTSGGRGPRPFRAAYPEAAFEIINRENYQPFTGVA